MPKNTSRHCSTRSTTSSGTVTAIAPNMPDAKATPFMVARRSAGYQSANAEKVDIKQPDTPRPISARASVSSSAEPASANQSPPAAATISSEALTRRGP